MAEMPPIVVQLTVDPDEIIRRLRPALVALVIEVIEGHTAELGTKINEALQRSSSVTIERVRKLVEQGQL